MSKLGYISNTVGKQLNLAVANTYSQNVLNGSNLPANSIIISSPIDSNGNDTGTYSIIATDGEGNPIRLTYSISEGNGLYYSSFSDSLKLNIDNDTIKTNSSYNLYSTLKSSIDSSSLISNSNETISVDINNIGIASNKSFGVAKLDGESIGNDNGKIFVNTSKLEYSNTLSETFGIGVGDGIGLISTNGLLEINESALERGDRGKIGVVRADGETIISNNGILSANTIAFAKAIKDRFGISKVDNIKLRLNKDNKVYVNTYSISSASDTNYGISKIDTNTLDIDANNILSAKKYISIKDYINKYYDLSEEYRNKLLAIKEEIAKNPKLLKKDEILLFSVNETSVISLDKPKYKEPVINMPDQYVNVDFNIITTCDFTLSILFDDATNELPSVTLINVNYNDEDIFEDNKIDPNKVYTSTNGELKKITLKFWAKNFSNSKIGDTISTNIFITAANANNTEKSITEKYGIIRYNSLYEKYEEDEEIIVDEGRWQLVSSSLEWQEIREDWNELGIQEDDRWQSVDVIIPNIYRKVKIRYKVQNLDTGEMVQESVVFEIVRGNAIKSSIGISNSEYEYILYNSEEHRAYKLSDFGASTIEDLVDDEKNLMYTDYNEVSDIVTYVAGEGQFISLQIKFKQQVFPAQMIYDPNNVGSGEFNIYTYLIQTLSLMFRIRESSTGSTYSTMLGVGSWNGIPSEDVEYWVYLDDEELTDFSKIEYNLDANNAAINSNFNDENDNTNHLKLFSKWSDGNSHVLRFIPVNDITKVYYREENFTSYFETIIDLFSVVIKNVKTHNETINISVLGEYDELTYSKKIEKIPTRIKYWYKNTISGTVINEERYVTWSDWGRNIYQVPDITDPEMEYTITHTPVDLSTTIERETIDGGINYWNTYLSNETYLTNQYFTAYGEVDSMGNWHIPIKQTIQYKDTTAFRALPQAGVNYQAIPGEGFSNYNTEHIHIVSVPAISVKGINYSVKDRTNIYVSYPNDVTDDKFVLENTHKLVTVANEAIELTVNNLLLISIVQEKIITTKPTINRIYDETDMFKYQINHASFNSSFESNTETSYQINTTTSQYISMVDNYTKSFTPGSSVAFWSVNTYVGKSNIEYAYFFDKYYDPSINSEDRLTYVIHDNKEIYYFDSSSGIKTYLYDEPNISTLTYYTFYKGHNHYTNNYTSYTLAFSTGISNHNMYSISLASTRNDFKNIVKNIYTAIDPDTSVIINSTSMVYQDYISFATGINNMNNYNYISTYSSYLESSSQPITTISDYNVGKVYFNNGNLYHSTVFNLNEAPFRDSLYSVMIDDTTQPQYQTDPNDPDNQIFVGYAQIHKYDLNTINNVIIPNINAEFTTIKGIHKQKLVDAIKGNHEYTIYTAIDNNSITFTNGIYFSTPTNIGDPTIKHYNGFNLFIWDLFDIFDNRYYNLQFYEYNSSGQKVGNWKYHGVEVLRAGGWKYNIGVFVMNSNFTQEPDFYIFDNPTEFTVYSLDYYNRYEIDYEMDPTNTQPTPITISLTLYKSIYNEITDGAMNYTYHISSGTQLDTEPTITSEAIRFNIPYNGGERNILDIQRYIEIDTNTYVYGPAQYIYLPPRQTGETLTFQNIIPRGSDNWKLFDIPDSAPGMYNLTSYEFFVLRSQNGIDSSVLDTPAFKTSAVMFSYVGTLLKGGTFDDYEVDYWQDEVGNGNKLIFALCDRHRSFFKTIPKMGSEEGVGNIKPYKWINPVLYTESNS